MKLKLRFLAPLFVGVLAPIAVSGAPETPAMETASISQITVQRTECYGTCPIDVATYNADGNATYAGWEYAPRRGLYRGKMAPKQFADLAAFLESQNYFELRAEIGDDRTTDVPYFMVSAVRDGVPYNVTFRPDRNPILEAKMEKGLIPAMETIKWQRDEAVSASGVRGKAQRPLTPRETRLFSDRKPPYESFPMRFAPFDCARLTAPTSRFRRTSTRKAASSFSRRRDAMNYRLPSILRRETVSLIHFIWPKRKR